MLQWIWKRRAKKEPWAGSQRAGSALAPCMTLAKAWPSSLGSPICYVKRSVVKYKLPQRPYSSSEGISSKFYSFFLSKRRVPTPATCQVLDNWKHMSHGPQPQVASSLWRKQQSTVTSRHSGQLDDLSPSSLGDARGALDKW